MGVHKFHLNFVMLVYKRKVMEQNSMEVEISIIKNCHSGFNGLKERQAYTILLGSQNHSLKSLAFSLYMSFVIAKITFFICQPCKATLHFLFLFQCFVSNLSKASSNFSFLFMSSISSSLSFFSASSVLLNFSSDHSVDENLKEDFFVMLLKLIKLLILEYQF